MVYSLSYRRPLKVTRESLDSDSTDDANGSLRSGNSNRSAGIPEALAFDKIINGGTCPVSGIISLIQLITLLTRHSHALFVTS